MRIATTISARLFSKVATSGRFYRHVHPYRLHRLFSTSSQAQNSYSGGDYSMEAFKREHKELYDKNQELKQPKMQCMSRDQLIHFYHTTATYVLRSLHLQRASNGKTTHRCDKLRAADLQGWKEISEREMNEEDKMIMNELDTFGEEFKVSADIINRSLQVHKVSAAQFRELKCQALREVYERISGKKIIEGLEYEEMVKKLGYDAKSLFSDSQNREELENRLKADLAQL